MTNGECINRKTVDYKSRMALEKDDFRRFSVMWEFRVTGHQVAARVASRLVMGFQAIQQTETLNQLISHNVWKQKKNIIH